jgi:hypothetical protein
VLLADFEEATEMEFLGVFMALLMGLSHPGSETGLSKEEGKPTQRASMEDGPYCDIDKHEAMLKAYSSSSQDESKSVMDWNGEEIKKGLICDPE